MTLKEILMHRKIGWLAVIGPIYALVSIWVAINLSPWFGWRTNAISDLGVHDVAPIFNISLIICGIMCAIFAVGAILRLKSRSGKIGMAIMFLASVSLVGIGVFTEDYSPHHFIFSVAFFVLLLLAALTLSPGFLLKKNTRSLGMAGFCVVVLGLFGWYYEATVGWGTGIAIPEALTFVPGAVWFAMIGHWSLKSNNRKNVA